MPIGLMDHEYVVGTIISLMALEPVLFTKQGTKCWYDSIILSLICLGKLNST